MCLLDILHTLSAGSREDCTLPDINPPESEPHGMNHVFPTIIAAHVNHGLRGETANADEELVRTYCDEKGIPFVSQTIDAAILASDRKISLEEAGRIARYSFFRETAAQYSTSGETVYIAVAHHREDQAETILMNLFRGSGPEGLCGMRPRNKDIIRPLLFASKEEIKTYLREKSIEYAEDATNQENHFTRNRWRNQILPLISEVSRKNPITPLLLTSEILSVDRDYFDEQTSRIFYESITVGGSGTIGLPCLVLAGEHGAIASRLIRRLYEDRFASAKDLSYAHVCAVMSIIRDGPGGRRIALSRGRTAYVSDGVLFFEDLSDLHKGQDRTWMSKTGALLLSDSENIEDMPLSIHPGQPAERVSISQTSYYVEAILVENPMQVVYNSRAWYCTREELSGAVVRTRRTGDRFSSAGSIGGKPLRRFLTDRKIPAFIRDRVILVARAEEVLWIPGIGHAKGFVDMTSRRSWDISHKPDQHGTHGQTSQEIVKITIYDGR